MASVFLSYDREDADKARQIATALEKAGHSVWWDLHVRGGAQFSKVIEEALKAADAVVVLWSRRSVDSAWVRDEAAAGRDSGRLVPVTIDGTQPPLGFRQFQTIDLSRRKAGRLHELFQAIDNLPTDAQQGVPLAASAERPLRSIPAWLLPAAAAFVVLTAAVFIAWRLAERGSPVPIVAVATADASPASQTLARDLLVKLGSLQSAKTNAMRLVGGGGQSGADFIFDTSGAGSPRLSKANLALLAGKDRTLLWSKDFQTEADAEADLEQQMAYTAGQVLDCAVQASESGRQHIDQDTLKLFLNGCALFAEKYRTDPQSVVPLFLQIVERAPRLEPAWRKLLLAESLVTRTERLLNRYTPGELPQHIAAVRQLNAEIPELFVAESVLLPLTTYARRSELLDRAVRLDPENPDLLLMRAEFNLGVGRNGDVVDDVTRAVELNPLNPGLRSHMIASLAYVGRVETAFEELRRAEKLWPNSAAIEDARFRLNNRYGDPKLAQQMLRAGKMRMQPMVSPMVERFLIARIEPTQANVQRAMTEAERRVASDPRSIGDLVQTAGEFHREEELYRMLLNRPDEKSFRILGEVLFRPTLARFRQDPRFMQVAARAGLPEYWRSSGRWPDFCFEPDLPYDCKKEAAKLSA